MRTPITELKASITKLKQKYKPEANENYTFPDSFDLDFITDEMQFLNQLPTPLAYDEKYVIEEYKLALLISYRSLLNQAIATIPVSPAAHVDIEPNPSYWQSYYTYLASGLGINIVHGYVSSHALLVLIPTISSPVLIAVATVMTALNALAYYLYEGYVLKKNLNIPILTQNSEAYFAIYEEQLKIIPTVNLKLENYAVHRCLTSKQYEKFGKVAGMFNESIMANKSLFNKYEESGASYYIRQGIIAFGALMAAGSAFFSANSFLKLVAAPLIATTGGTLFLGICVGLAVTFYFGQRVHKVYKMMNPEAYKYKSIQEQYQLLKPRLQAYYTKILSHKQTEEKDRKDETPQIAPAPEFATARTKHRIFDYKKQDPQTIGHSNAKTYRCRTP